MTRLVLVVAVVLAAGCGGEASRSGFSADAEAVCTEANGRVRALALDALQAGRSAASRYGLDACSRLARSGSRVPA